MAEHGLHLIELGRFAVTGAAAWFVDVLVFNLLSAGAGHLPAKVISSIAAVTVAYLGSRYYTWPGHRPSSGHPIMVFVAISAAAAAVQLGCLWLSHDVIGWTGVIADNLSANVVGMAAATALRFWGFRNLIFRAPARESVPMGVRGSGAVG
ncbi:GtrA family protein [Homoserinimonas sp. OAct 916]|uniref:GtrA family protein n=1 Tax=Homoserinimonas sp. OAct 916 TaxID=2211450 RepID=UPI000DBE66BE|nr:GtrA family protein [Homoserinimonas sp. OAct 916]